jgi:hypothetical protein
MGLKKANPFREEGCSYNDPLCRVDPKVDCGKMGICYAVTCDCCGDVVPTTEPPLPPQSRQQHTTQPDPTNRDTTTNVVLGTVVSQLNNDSNNSGIITVATQPTTPVNANMSIPHTTTTTHTTSTQMGPTQQLVEAARTNWALQHNGAQVVAGSRANNHHHTSNNTMGKTRSSGNHTKGPQKLPKIFQEFDRRPHYLGHSSRSMHVRMMEHLTSAAKRDTNNAMARHIIASHASDTTPPTFTMTKVTSHTKNVVRQATEGVLLERQEPSLSLNDRMEWGRRIVRLHSTNV